MADNTNPQAIRFCNEKLRPACDRLISAIRTIREMRAEWDAQGIGPLVAGSQELLDGNMADGSASDGRTRITGYDANLANTSAQALLTWCDGDGAASIAALTKPTVNTEPVF